MAVELLPRAVLRAARWPVETAEAFTWRPSGTSELRRHEEDVASRRLSVTSALHAVVPSITDAAARRYLLTVKRAVHGRLEPFDPPDDCVSRVLDAAAPAVVRLLADERADRVSLAQRHERFRIEHDAELDRQRGILRDATSDREFRLALTVANPEVAARWDRAGSSSPADHPPARDRRLEAAVLNYLLRAAGRPMPSGMWAGVTEVAPKEAPAGPALQVEPSAPRFIVSARLHQFAVALDALSALPRYREHAALRLNPTLHAHGEGWRYERFVDGRSEWARLEEHPVTATALDHWGDGEPRRADALVQRLSGGDARLAELAWASVRGLVAGGVLVGPLSLPTGAASVWDALASVTPLLEPPERDAWRTAVDAVRERCDRLGRVLGDLVPDDFRRRAEDVTAVIQRLWDDVGIGGAVPTPVFDVDVRLPFSAAWDTNLRRRIAESIGGLIDIHGRVGLAPLYHRTARRALADAFDRSGTRALLPTIASGTAVAGAVVEADLPDSAPAIFSARLPCDAAVLDEVRALVDRLEHELEPVHSSRQHTLDPPELVTDIPGDARDICDQLPTGRPAGADAGRMGTLLVTVAGDAITLGWGRPQPGLFVSRFANVLAHDGTEPGVATEIRRLMRPSDGGRRAVEVVGADPANPEAALRPEFIPDRFDPHGGPDASLAGVVAEIEHGDVVLRRPGEAASLVPVYNSAAAIGSVDPCSALLFSLAMVQGWEYLSFPFPTCSAETQRWRHLPRLVLDDGTPFSAERWTLDVHTVSAIREAEGATRYLRWRGEIEDRGIPDLVYLRGGREPSALARLFPTASPLAVRCLFESMRDEESDRLVLSELPVPTEALAVADDRGHYISELAVIWHDDVACPGSGDIR